jgi:hypothetical protein
MAFYCDGLPFAEPVDLSGLDAPDFPEPRYGEPDRPTVILLGLGPLLPEIPRDEPCRVCGSRSSQLSVASCQRSGSGSENFELTTDNSLRDTWYCGQCDAVSPGNEERAQRARIAATVLRQCLAAAERQAIEADRGRNELLRKYRNNLPERVRRRLWAGTRRLDDGEGDPIARLKHDPRAGAICLAAAGREWLAAIGQEPRHLQLPAPIAG